MSRAPFEIAPKMRPIPPRRSAVVGVLDVGTSKIVCLIARLKPRHANDALRRRSHAVEILGIGHTRSHGMKGGAVVDMERAEQSIRRAVDAAERMAGVQIASVVCAVSGGRLGSEHYVAEVDLPDPAVAEGDIRRVLDAASTFAVGDGRCVLHALPVGYALDAVTGISEPRGMLGRRLGVDLHVITADVPAARNLLLCIERCHLGVEAMVAAPYAAALSTLADDESQLGCTLIDFGAGTTTVSVVTQGHCVYVDGVALGGQHITNDVARGLSTRLVDAERLKTLHGGVTAMGADDRELLTVPAISDDDRDLPHAVPKSQLLKIIRPRIEETVELVRDRLVASGHMGDAGRRIVLTGGAAQLIGLTEIVGKILGPQVRVGRPLGISRLPEAARGAPFAVAAGLLVYPQVAGLEHFEARRHRGARGGTDGYFSRVGNWLREAF
ncbi:cell division protein FtsA [Ancylobacter sp. 6x-1]|uniref:Cell division protein FtsA n=1 Tax=Ancylobacter crimeensis TaxID=2579147 RepID=A0ABT0DED1_9HYPH|nr:cell division protein FtsA [Ancylobacter crimeensis]MCK0198229.1 cell division protein FtsA [Ancylobacter crimeensis]